MQPPAEMPLIHGSTTPSAKEVATAASIASPPASRTAAPTSAARLCADATMPPRVGTTALRTTCDSEKLSRIFEGKARDVGVRGKPHAFVPLHVPNQLFQDPQARAVAADMRVHGELEEAAFAVGGVELALEDVEHRFGRRVGPQAGEAVHVEVHRIVADPFHRQLHHAGRLAVQLELVAIHIRHERGVVEKAHRLRDRECVRAEVPRRRADADRSFARHFFQDIRGATLKVIFIFKRQMRIALVDPAVDADLVAFGNDAALLIRIEERGDGGHEEARLDVLSFQDLEDSGNALAISVLPLRQLADGLAAVAQLVRLMVGVEGERDRAARAAFPLRRPQRASGAHVVDERAPVRLGPLPRLLLLAFHRFIFFSRSLMNADSFATNFANSAGGMPTASKPCASNCVRTSGSASAFTISACSLVTSSGEAPAGSQRPNQLMRL